MDTPFTIVMYRTFHAQRNAIRPGMADIGLSPGQPKILHYLLNHDGCMQRELADACDIEPATVSRLLDKMEEDGLVRREIPPQTHPCLLRFPDGSGPGGSRPLAPALPGNGESRPAGL